MFFLIFLDLPLDVNHGSHFEPIGLFEPTTLDLHLTECASSGCIQTPDPALESIPKDQARFTPAWTFGFT